MDTDTKEEPLELPEDHPAVVEDRGEEDTARGDSADQDAPKESRDQPAVAEDGGDDPDDDLETEPTTDTPPPEPAADTPPPKPHYKKEVHRLDFAEGPFPALLWRAMQRIGFPLRPRYEAHLYKNA